RRGLAFPRRAWERGEWASRSSGPAGYNGIVRAAGGGAPRRPPVRVRTPGGPMPRLAAFAVLLLACAACKKADPDAPAAAAADGEGGKKLAVGMPAPPLKVAQW